MAFSPSHDVAGQEAMMQALDDTPYPLDHLALRGGAIAPAVHDRGGVLDYAGLERAIGALAAALAKQGLNAGDRVASWIAKTRLACILPLACARAGLIHVPINPLLKHSQVRHILSDSDASLLIANAARAESLISDKSENPWRVVIEGQETDTWLCYHDVMPPSSQSPEMLAALLYTSGSTGLPKGVMLSHANLWLGAIAVAHYLALDDRTRTLCVLPFAFDYGQNQLFSTWAAGGCITPLDYLTRRDVTLAVEKFDINTLAGVPPLWAQLVEGDWPPHVAARLRCLTNSGGRLPVPIVRSLRALFPQAALHSMYGLTEAFRSTSLDPAMIDDHPDAIGTAIPFTEILVVDEGGQPVSNGTPGELVHVGPLVAQGYWQDPVKTAERFRPAPAASDLGGTAVWSGDTVLTREDGLLYFVSRADAMIKTAGNRVSPTEIEEVAVGSGLVCEAVAFGIPDETLGATIGLVVRGAEDQDAALRLHLRQQLPNFMQPRLVVWRADLPKTPNGKVDRVAVIAQVVQ